MRQIRVAALLIACVVLSLIGAPHAAHAQKNAKFHYANTLSVINQPKWDVVVMHDFSTGPVPAARTGNPDSFTNYADLLEQTIHAANKSAAIYLYETCQHK